MEKGFVGLSVIEKICANKHFGNAGMHSEQFATFLKSSLIVVACCLMVACMPIKDESINAELFKDKEEMKVRTAELQRGMNKAEAFEVLNVPIEKFTAMSTPEVQVAVYGNSVVQGSPSELEKFRQRLLGYEGYSLPYRHVESTGSLGFAKMKVDKTGHDLRLVMVFDGGKLMKADVVGDEEYASSEDQYFWSNLLKTGVGTVF